MAPQDLNALTQAIARGVVDGNKEVVSVIVSQSDKRHDLRNLVETQVLKTGELDREVVLMKGMMVMLIGDGDGSTGMVPQIQRDMKLMSSEVNDLKTQVTQLGTTMARVEKAVTDLSAGQQSQKGWIDSWKGVGIFLGIMATCFTLMSGVVVALYWLFTHASH